MMMESTTYRMGLARGFLAEAQQDLTLQRWRSCVASAQLVVENALKAAISLFLPVPKTHDPARLLLELVARKQIPQPWGHAVQKLAEAGQPLGPQVHVQTDYGDEYSGRLPWDLFGEEDANEALVVAEKVIEQVELLIQGVSNE